LQRLELLNQQYSNWWRSADSQLARYLAEFDFRYSNRAKLGVDDKTRADLALVGAKGKRLIYQGTRGTRTEAPAF
jgi:hypothetical protein